MPETTIEVAITLAALMVAFLYVPHSDPLRIRA